MVVAGIVDALSKLHDFLEMNEVQHHSDSPGGNEANDDEDDDGNVSDGEEEEMFNNRLRTDGRI